MEAVVTFTVSANDAVDGPITPDCDHQSGDTFPLGDTLVTLHLLIVVIMKQRIRLQ